MNGKTSGNYRYVLEREGKRKKGVRILFLLLLLLLLILAAVIGLGFAENRLGGKRYFEYISDGNRYLSEMNYRAAEQAFLKAIETDPENETAYDRLTALYLSEERLEEAKKMLLRGIGRTNSSVLVRTYESVLLRMEEGEKAGKGNAEVSLKPEEYALLSGDVTLNHSLLDVAGTYTYSDYLSHFGRPETTEGNEAGGCNLRFKGFSGVLSYYDTETNALIFDEAKGMPYGNMRPNEIRVEMDGLFGRYQGVVVEKKLRELFGDGVSVNQLEDESWRLEIFSHGCTIYIDCDSEGNILGHPVGLLIPPAKDNEYEMGEKEEGDAVSGYVLNAVNGGGVPALLIIRKDGQTGMEIARTSALADGSFRLNVESGNYTIEIRAEGFIPVYEEITVIKGQALTGLNIVLSPELAQGEIRIVLTWGEQPYDLDSHLEGTASDGRRISVHYQHMEQDGVAQLDVDDTYCYGPETTTVYDAGGSYLFYVHDFTNRRTQGSQALSASGAVVKIYLPDSSQPVEYAVPSGNGTIWKVCKIEGGQVISVNTIE